MDAAEAAPLAQSGDGAADAAGLRVPRSCGICCSVVSAALLVLVLLLSTDARSPAAAAAAGNEQAARGAEALVAAAALSSLRLELAQQLQSIAGVNRAHATLASRGRLSREAIARHVLQPALEQLPRVRFLSCNYAYAADGKTGKQKWGVSGWHRTSGGEIDYYFETGGDGVCRNYGTGGAEGKQPRDFLAFNASKLMFSFPIDAAAAPYVAVPRAAPGPSFGCSRLRNRGRRGDGGWRRRVRSGRGGLWRLSLRR